MMEFEISLENLRFHAAHGVFDQERVVGNEFIVNLSVRIPYVDSIAQDELSHTISYADLYDIVKCEISQPRKLMESVAASIVREITIKWPQIISGKVIICKSTPPISGITGDAKVSLFF